jgi:hypothetical protein
MEYEPVSADELCPQAVVDRWPDAVPIHGITILDAIRPDGRRALHVCHDTDAPMWVLIGLLKCVLSDLEARWVITDYTEDDLYEDD